MGMLPAFAVSRETVYVLPEDGPVQAMFGQPHADTAVATAAHRVNVSAR